MEFDILTKHFLNTTFIIFKNIWDLHVINFKIYEINQNTYKLIQINPDNMLIKK